jgi:hypothetical protein
MRWAKISCAEMGKDSKVKNINKQRQNIPAPYIFKSEELAPVEQSEKTEEESETLGSYQRVMSLSRMIRRKIEKGL